MIIDTSTYCLTYNPLQPWSVPFQASVPKFSAFQASIFYPTSQQILYFGGTFEDTSLPDYVPASQKYWHKFSYALAFDTVTSIWRNQTLQGIAIPTARVFHTTTLCKY
jgi:outer membrane protein assembly factor BamB